MYQRGAAVNSRPVAVDVPGGTRGRPGATGSRDQTRKEIALSALITRRPTAGVLAVLSAVVVAMAVLLGVAGGAARGDMAPNTVLSLNASPTIVKTGSTTSLFGELAQKNGGGIKGKRVVLQQKAHKAPAGDFQRVPGQPAEGLLTGDGGEFKLLSVQPSANTDYRARFVQGSKETTSRTVQVGVKVNVELQVLRKHSKSGNDSVLFGKVSPAQSQGSLSLTIKRDGQKLTRRVSLSNSAFLLKIAPKAGGKYTVIANYSPADGQTNFMGNNSVTKRFTVH